MSEGTAHQAITVHLDQAIEKVILDYLSTMEARVADLRQVPWMGSDERAKMDEAMEIVCQARREFEAREGVFIMLMLLAELHLDSLDKAMAKPFIRPGIQARVSRMQKSANAQRGPKDTVRDRLIAEHYRDLRMQPGFNDESDTALMILAGKKFRLKKSAAIDAISRGEKSRPG